MRTHAKVLFSSGVTALSLILCSALPALASAPQFDSGVDIVSVDKPYQSAQPLKQNIFSTMSVYGKLTSSTSADIYSFQADRDGDQTFSLLVASKPSDAAAPKPYLFLIDPTSATKAEQIGLPLPAADYHVAVMAPQTDKTYLDPATLQKYSVSAEQKVALKKGSKYYFVIVDQYGQPTQYVLRTGSGTSWTARDILTHPGDWFRIAFDSYAGTNPFTVTVTTLSTLLLLLALALFIGTFAIESIFSFLANRSKAAGYLLIKMQRFSRTLYWVSLVGIALGGYLYFTRLSGFVGIPAVMILCFLVLVIVTLYHTVRLTPRLSGLKVVSREATIPFALRKRLFFSFLVTLFSAGALLTFLSMLLTNR